ncbi:MAG: extracellular solute-binding protein [Lachnospiraceae bacterium]
MKKGLILFLCCILLIGCNRQEKKSALDPKNPTEIVIWHYYNGQQQDAFAKLVLEFNQTIGLEVGVHIEEYSQGDVTALEEIINDAAEGKVSVGHLPNLFAGYASTVYHLDQQDLIADISPYFTQDELNLYIDGYINEGGFGYDGTLKIFPIAKSTELFFMNLTDWNVFAESTNASLDDLSTIEGITETAKAYYEWTDSLTPETPNDGLAFFGRDAFANYMIIGTKQLGSDIFSVENNDVALNYDKSIVRKLWDNYYTPMVAGWYAAENRFRSDDAKLGIILSCVGSSSSTSYFPTSRVVSDTESYDIETYIAPAPKFANSDNYAVQQGAGFAVTKASDAEIEAATVFLKWFSEPERNSLFSVESGYLPVTKEASTTEYLSAIIESNFVSNEVSNGLLAAVKTTQENNMYTTPAFSGGTTARSILESSMPEAAIAARNELLERIAQGENYHDVLSQLTSDDVFELWYTNTNQQLLESITVKP